MTIKNILTKYYQKIDPLDLEILIAHVIKQPREFVLAHPEYKLTQYQVSCIKYDVSKRVKGKPVAYILRYKEFFGLDFKVNKNTLIPRLETELLVELALQELETKNHKLQTSIIDVGTGSGNIIISLVKSLGLSMKNKKLSFFGIDISDKALQVAKYNAKKHGVSEKIKFLKGNLLDPFLKNKKYIIPNTRYMLLANLPYLSPAIYKSVMPDVKNFEPKSALLSENHGLAHYEKLFKQLVKCQLSSVNCFLEISPEQKPKLAKLIKKHLPSAKIEFKKDLADKWRVCHISV